MAARGISQIRDFLLLWSGPLLSPIGSQVSQLAFPLVVLAITHSPVQAGLVGALRGLPFALLCLPAGALVDRWDRKRVMLLSDRRSGPLHAGSIPLVLLQRENSAGESRKRSGK